MKRTVEAKPKTILVNDPSITGWGYVVLNWKGEILLADCIKTEPGGRKSRIRKGDHTVRRISEINKILIDVIAEYNVCYILSELPHGSQNASAAVMIGAVAAIAQTLSDTLKIGIEWYSEGDAKKCLLKKQSATKQEIINAIDKLYKVPWKRIKYKDEAIADAMAIYHAASYQSETLKMLKMM